MKNLFVILVIVICMPLFAGIYPDQHYVLEGEQLFERIESFSGTTQSADGKSICLADGEVQGTVVFHPDSSEFPYNRGLPSWNGQVLKSASGFKVQMRFPTSTGWSPWLTAGFWKDHIWSSYGSTEYSGGEIDYDYVKLKTYQQRWQFRILFKRRSAADPSPSLHKLSFFISDSRTTANTDYQAILRDKPEEIFIDADFYYQYDLDPNIGHRICSPTTVSMILSSFGLDVDPVEFSQKAYDPYYRIFGVWPRNVQAAYGHGLDGAVTRYRSWSQAREVLANGGGIAMSVGKPLYTGHLMMLAGFTAEGNPIVHDPAKSRGYALVYNKSDLSRSWFAKGGIAYTFYPSQQQTRVDITSAFEKHRPDSFMLHQNYPNPFNHSTRIAFELQSAQHVNITVYTLNGQRVTTLYDAVTVAGVHEIVWDASEYASGTYLIRMTVGNNVRMIKGLYIK
jgi:hypothetical protein